MNVHVYIIVMCTLVAGCAKEVPAPVYLTAEQPTLPEQCFPDQVDKWPEQLDYTKED